MNNDTTQPREQADAPYPYDALFRAIGDAVNIVPTNALSISVKQFVETLAARGYCINRQAAPEALEEEIIKRRIAITPEHEGGFHAMEYGDDDDTAKAKGYGETPSAAVRALQPVAAPEAPDDERQADCHESCGYIGAECDFPTCKTPAATTASALPPPELTWLYTHCRAIGMNCKSDSGKWEHDIALFTINLVNQIKATTASVSNDDFTLSFSREDWGVIFDGVMLEIERSEKRKQTNSESNSDTRAEQGRAILAAIRSASLVIPAATTASASEDLLPCPFCGAHLPTIWSLTTYGGRHTIKCTECPGRAEFYSSLRGQAIAAWNRRAPAPSRDADDLNGGMHASIFVKVWGDAGGGDAGRIALANYAFDLGRRAALTQQSAAQAPSLAAILNCYSPDDTANDYQDKIRHLYAAQAAHAEKGN